MRLRPPHETPPPSRTQLWRRCSRCRRCPSRPSWSLSGYCRRRGRRPSGGGRLPSGHGGCGPLTTRTTPFHDPTLRPLVVSSTVSYSCNIVLVILHHDIIAMLSVCLQEYFSHPLVLAMVGIIQCVVVVHCLAVYIVLHILMTVHLTEHKLIGVFLYIFDIFMHDMIHVQNGPMSV